MPDGKNTIMGSEEIASVIESAASSILEWDPDSGNIVLVGIRTRGVPLAERLRAEINRRHGAAVRMGILDITLYRDDLNEVATSPLVRGTEIPFDLQGVTVILVDDVLYTGRTVRAALDQLIDFGRPRAIKLVVLVDRGLRELPIAPDFTGRVVETRPGQDVTVLLRETDGDDEVRITEKE
jgi:pyrimidine operon attenuation protein/uracil phosphoribosyltransferase